MDPGVTVQGTTDLQPQLIENPRGVAPFQRGIRSRDQPSEI